MAKYLDYEVLKTLIQEQKKYISGITGTGYSTADNNCNIKEYIDSRIFVGTAAEIELALQLKKIDDSTFTMVLDEDAEEMTSISDSDINNLFA